MIPKIIHYCWLSSDPFPASISRTMSSWREKLPDYEFIHWDLDRFSLEESIWVRQAFEVKKYAFAADFIRLYAVYHYGGIYLDTDVEVIKNFDDLLHLPYFVGSEDKRVIEAGIFGAAKNCSWIKTCLEYYKDKEFIKQDGRYDMLTLPRIMMGELSPRYNLVYELKGRDVPYPDDIVVIFPQDYFCAKNQGTGIITKTLNTYTVHHFAMSWSPKRKTFLSDIKRKLMAIFGVRAVSAMVYLLRLKKLKNLLIRKF
jgi:hypothetical protein